MSRELRRAGGLAALAAAACLALSPRLPFLFDDAGYRELARGLLEGRGYWVPHPEGLQRPNFPPGFPVLLLPFEALAGAVPSAPRLPSLAAAALLGALLAVSSLPLAAAAAAALHPFVLLEALRPVPELWFLALTVAALELGERDRGRAAWLAAVGAAYLRTAGLAAVLAVLAARAARRPREAALQALAAAVVLLPLGLLTSSYSSHFLRGGPAEWASNLALHLGKYPVEFATGFLAAGVSRSGSPAPLFALKLAASLALAGVAAWGWLGRARKPGPWELFVVFYSGLVCAWPFYDDDPRFFLPLLPALVRYLVLGARRLAGERGAGAAAAGLLACSLAGDAALAAGGALPRLYPSYGAAYFEDYLEAAAWLKAEAEPAAVILAPARSADSLRLHSGRRVLPAPPSAEALRSGDLIVADLRCCPAFAEAARRAAEGPPVFRSAGGFLEILPGVP